jgi:hypothetical protein
MVDAIAQRYGALPGNLDAGHVAALKELWHLAYREASTCRALVMQGGAYRGSMH